MQTSIRIGHGYDLHRLQPGGTLILGTVPVSNELSPIAHSDGDVAAHALVDAILGALGLGDIGDHFPNNDPQWRGAPSRVFLEHALKRMTEAGYRLLNADLLVLAEKPRLKEFKGRIANALSALLGCPVNVKAGTNEGCDAIGRGEAIACHAVVLLSGS